MVNGQISNQREIMKMMPTSSEEWIVFDAEAFYQEPTQTVNQAEWRPIIVKEFVFDDTPQFSFSTLEDQLGYFAYIHLCSGADGHGQTNSFDLGGELTPSGTITLDNQHDHDHKHEHCKKCGGEMHEGKCEKCHKKV